MKQFPMTQRGAAKLRDELEHLKRVIRPHLIHAIAEARAHGDLRENAEYKAAREEQAFCEGRIKDIELKLASAQIIDTERMPPNDVIVFGAYVQLKHENDHENVHDYQIVGDDEADIKQGYISISSPLARGLIGKTEGETITIQTPKGPQHYEILSIDYGRSMHEKTSSK